MSLAEKKLEHLRHQFTVKGIVRWKGISGGQKYKCKIIVRSFSVNPTVKMLVLLSAVSFE